MKYLGTTSVEMDAVTKKYVDDAVSKGNTAYGWGNHATAGYLKTHQDISGKQDKITTTNKLSASLVSGLATVATSGKYSDLSGTPTIPTTLPASDVYAWAKAATKPTYNWGEITNSGADNIVEGTSDFTDNTELLTSYASNNGFADTTAKGIVYRRDAIRVFNYIKGKLPSWATKSSLAASDVPTLNQNTTGNAATATKLATSRSIWGQSFNGSADVNGNLTISTSSAADKYVKLTDGSKTVYFGQDGNGDGYVWGSSNAYLYFLTNATERMRITTDGNVGIGVSNPLSKLHLNGDIRISNSNDNASTRAITIGYSSGANVSAGDIVFRNGDMNGFKISSVFKDWAARQDLVFYSSNNTTEPYASSWSETMRISHLGKVGIGTNAPDQLLDVGGTIAARGTMYLKPYSASIGTEGTDSTTATGWYRIGQGIAASSYGWGGILFISHSYTYTWAESYVISIAKNYSNEVVFTLLSGSYHDANQIIKKIRIDKSSSGDVWFIDMYLSISALKNTFYVSAIGGISTCKPTLATQQGTTTEFTLENGLKTNSSIIGNTLRACRVPSNDHKNQYLDINVVDVQANFDGYDSDGYMHFNFRSNGTSRMFINGNSGNVGVGTTNPAHKLEVAGGNMRISRTVGGDKYLQFYDGTNNGYIGQDANGLLYLYNSQANPMYFATSGTSRMYIAGDGNVGIGTTSPTSRLEVNSSSSGVIKIKRTTSGTGAYIHYYNGNNNTTTCNWEVGVNSASDFVWYYQGNTTALALSSNGNLVAAGNVAAYSSASDMRLKTITESSYDALGILNSLSTFKYKWNDQAKSIADIFKDDNEEHFGLSAQEIQKVRGYLVSKAINNEYYVLKKDELVPLLVRAIKQLTERVEELENKRLLNYKNNRI